jgi:stage IV sporulation protein FB
MKLVKLKGIQIIFNDFFVLLLLAYGMSGVFPHAIFTFGIILSHELAHSYVAKKAGMKVREVELYPFGGVARIEGMLEYKPSLEVKVALAGPLSNFFLLYLGFLAHRYFNWRGYYYQLFQMINLTMGLFNLLPAFPLDGGRIFRALLSRKLGVAEATYRASLWGKYCAVILFFLGFLGIYLRVTDLNIFVVAFFLYYAASKQEEAKLYVFLRYLLRKNQEFNSQEVLAVKRLAAFNNATIKSVLPKFSPGKYHVVTILTKEGGIKGEVTEHQIIDALFTQGSSYELGKLLL